VIFKIGKHGQLLLTVYEAVSILKLPNVDTGNLQGMDSKLKRIEIEVNGSIYNLFVETSDTLLDVLREKLELKGTKQGCENGQCGSCTVLLEEKPVNACLMLAVQVNHKRITTIEGLYSNDRLHPIQDAFIKAHAVQCGYCTPGMILTTKALLDKNETPDDEEIREALSGNACRCTGYTKIIDAVKIAAEKMNPQKS